MGLSSEGYPNECPESAERKVGSEAGRMLPKRRKNMKGIVERLIWPVGIAKVEACCLQKLAELCDWRRLTTRLSFAQLRLDVPVKCKVTSTYLRDTDFWA